MFVTFVFGLVFGSFKSEDYIAMLNVQAKTAAAECSKSGWIRVIVQDNSSIHTSKVTRQHWAEWEVQGLYVFFLPAYCSEMNSIEGEWQHLKRDELVGQMFECEAELAYNVIIGLEDRGRKNGRSTQYVDVKAT